MLAIARYFPREALEVAFKTRYHTPWPEGGDPTDEDGFCPLGVLLKAVIDQYHLEADPVEYPDEEDTLTVLHELAGLGEDETLPYETEIQDAISEFLSLLDEDPEGKLEDLQEAFGL